MKKADYLIVGQGIVGSVMALSLLRRGKTVVIIDEPKLSSSSKIAGGVYNPFNFRQMMNNWRAVEMVRSARELYSFAEKISGEKIHTQRDILKIFTSADERKVWERAFVERENLLAQEEVMESNYGEAVIAPFGFGVVDHAGSIDCGMLMYVVAEKMRADGNVFSERFISEKLQLKSEGAIYDERVEAKRVIFCEGWLAQENKWFSFMPIKPAKGQLLHVSIPGLKLKEILSRGVSLLPMGNDRFILSATFDNDAVDELTTETAKEELLSKLKKFITLPVHMESQFAGIRPAVQDRRPYIGSHPEYKQLSIINGMGSKAVLLAPWLSERLIDYIENRNEIPEEVRLDRFMKR